jgi:predicted aconitase
MTAVRLTHLDQLRLAGDYGPAQRFAMDLLVRVARNQRATSLVDVTQAHLVGSYHSGPGNLALLQGLTQQQAQVVIPTTLNASTEDLYQAAPANTQDYRHTCAVVAHYQALGCELTLTCAPYHLPRRPHVGECIAWAESNAVVYANSVLGARTNMTVQYLDLCAALTGRMPAYGLYLDHKRRGQCVYDVQDLPARWLDDDGFFQLLGFHIGRRCGQHIPVLLGLPKTTHRDQLRALGAAAAAAGAVNMLHAVGLTPEATSLDHALHNTAPLHTETVTRADILHARAQLGGRLDVEPESICLGTPHFSFDEFQQLINLLGDRPVLPNKALVVTTSRHTLAQLGGQAQTLTERGVTLITDRCCYYPSQLAQVRSPVLTNAAKWAYYGPGNLGIEARFARLPTCVAIATGQAQHEEAFWHD